jgi:cytochrome P450
MAEAALPLVPRPDHVSPDRVVDFDFWNVPGVQDDLHLAIRAFQQSAPDIFWTPHNGGHWVVMRAEDVDVMQHDYERFSHHCYSIPKKPESTPRELPLEVDPPRHTILRRPLTAALLPKVVNALEPRIRSLAASLIDEFVDRGRCEFVSEFSTVLPICIFLDLVDLPREDRSFLLPITEKVVRGRTAEMRLEGQNDLLGYIGKTVRERRVAPGDDLMSVIVNIDEGGKKISEDDAIAYASLVMFGGLDTVTAVLSHVARFLARNPEHRRDIVANLWDEGFMRGAIEELCRRHGAGSTGRVITRDMEYKGAQLREGEMILVLNMMAGLDERSIPDPLTLDFRRSPPARLMMFGNGPHTCPGAVLARRELKIFLQEWLSRIPDYDITPGSETVSVTGLVSGILKLDLSWPVATN